MWIISRKDGRLWKPVLQITDTEWDAHFQTIKFMVQCGVDLKLSWKDKPNG